MTHATRLMSPTFCRADGGRMPNTGGWQDRHCAALVSPRGYEAPIASLLHSWARYADYHAASYGSGIGEDSVLGPYWATIGVAIRGLLNGQTGRLDCGTLDGYILNTLQAEGFSEEGERV